MCAMIGGPCLIAAWAPSMAAAPYVVHGGLTYGGVYRSHTKRQNRR